MVRNDSVIFCFAAGRMLLTNDQIGQTGESSRAGLAPLTNDVLEAVIRAQREAVAGSEQAFAEARRRLAAQRQRLHELEDEQKRREGGQSDQTIDRPATRASRRRSTTGMDAVYGRDGIDPSAALGTHRFVSLQRAEVVLDEAGDAGRQAIRFVDKNTGEQLMAHTFGQARELLESGHGLGQVGVSLQRQVVWYVETRRAGKLRLDQIFVERREEG